MLLANMAVEEKAQTLGKFLESRLGVELLAEEVHALEGSCRVELGEVPLKVNENQIKEAIIQFYEQIGFQRDKELEPKLEEPVLYKGPAYGEKSVFVVLSDNRRHNRDVSISVEPLYSTFEKDGASER